MKLVIPHDKVTGIQNDNENRISRGLPPIESRIPSQETLDLVNETIRGAGGFRKGISTTQLMEALDNVSTSSDTGSENDDLNQYLAEIPDDINIKHITRNSLALHVTIKVPIDEDDA